MKVFLPRLSHNITFNALHQLPPPNVFLWSAPEPCSPLGKWLDWVPPKRYQDTTHTTQHRWDQLLLLNHSWIVTETWSRILEPILDSCCGPGGPTEFSACLSWCKTCSKSFSVLKKPRMAPKTKPLLRLEFAWAQARNCIHPQCNLMSSVLWVVSAVFARFDAHQAGKGCHNLISKL